jgi:hypothetical protein
MILYLENLEKPIMDIAAASSGVKTCRCRNPYSGLNFGRCKICDSAFPI